MVNRLVYPFILIGLLWSLAASVLAAQQTLSVEPDRKRLYQGEVLTLTVKGSMKIDLNLSNLFDFDVSSLPKPDIEKVETNFDILGRNQQYSIRTVNNDMVGEITWTYQLAPKDTGRLTIPSLTFQDAVSKPVTVEVVDGSPPDQPDDSRDSFIELAADKDRVYVQEQLILTVKLFFTGNMIRGELSEPSHPNAIIESLGKQTEYTRYRGSERYRVVERRYAIFPQKPGELTLQPIRFEGQARDASGQLKFLRDSKQLFTIDVAEVPAEFTGDTWLPASNLSLTEQGLPENTAIKAGENLSRQLLLIAEGLPAEALPPFPDAMPDSIRAYPEKAERNTTPNKQGLTSQLAQTTALVPIQGGKITLPEIRIPWWDTENDVEKVATIPARTLDIEAIPGQASAPVEQQTATESEPEIGEPSADPTGKNSEESSEENSWLWPVIAGVLLAGWAITVLLWWLSRRSNSHSATESSTTDASEKALFSQLCESAKAGAPETPDHLVRWVSHNYPTEKVVSLPGAFALLHNPVVEREIQALQARHYSKQSATAEGWQGDRLVEALTETRAKISEQPDKASPLPSLYPSELRSS